MGYKLLLNKNLQNHMFQDKNNSIIKNSKTEKKVFLRETSNCLKLFKKKNKEKKILEKILKRDEVLDKEIIENKKEKSKKKINLQTLQNLIKSRSKQNKKYLEKK